VQVEHGNDFIQIQGKRQGLLALTEALQGTLADGNAELKTFDEAGAAVRLVIHHEIL
jgi:hypothetical protein